jgi:hypothetical protein
MNIEKLKRLQEQVQRDRKYLDRVLPELPPARFDIYFVKLMEAILEENQLNK